MTLTPLEQASGVPKYKQIIQSVENAISDKKLKKGDKLPSVSQIQKENKVSRDTVLTALNELKTRGIVQSIAGKGYYVLSEDIQVGKKVFVLFDELNAFKEDLYNSLLQNLEDHTEVDIYFHHFNTKVFNKLILESIGKYSYYVIMPANLQNTQKIIKQLPKNKVYVLDQMQDDLKAYAGIYQNFEKDIYKSLVQGLDKIKEYNKLILLFSKKQQPLGMLTGFTSFCKEYNLSFEVINSVENQKITKGAVYVIPDDRNLIRIVKKIKEQEFILSKEVGIISYNDTLLKEIVEGGITTISTDFKVMGQRLAQMINEKELLQIENTNRLILRESL